MKINRVMKHAHKKRARSFYNKFYLCFQWQNFIAEVEIEKLNLNEKRLTNDFSSVIQILMIFIFDLNILPRIFNS